MVCTSVCSMYFMAKYYKHSMIVIYKSDLKISYCDSRIVTYDCQVFVRLAKGLA